MNLKSISIFLILGLGPIFSSAQKNKIDGVAVVVGKNVVLDSDIEKFKKELETQSEGKIKVSDCEMLEQLMERKLLAHHAVVDSVTVSKAEVDDRVTRTIAFFTREYGDQQKAVEAYGFNDIEDLKKELERVQKEELLIEKEQEKITGDIDLTPEEVRLYFNGLKEKNELPEFPAEVELAQIVLKAEPTEEENKRIIAKLNEIKKDVEENDASFKLKAIVNSNDPSVARNGGNLGTINKDTQFIKEFKEVAFSLDEGQISEPFKTIFGYHIILLHKIKGKGREVSHIVMAPEISDQKLSDAKEKLEKIRKDIIAGDITFEKAVNEFSQDADTKNSGGLILNPYTGESTFDLTRMDPALYGRINELQKGGFSEVFYDETRGGEKMYKLLYMRNRTNTHTAELVNDYVKIQKLALLKKKEETIAKWTKDKISETYVKIGSDHKKCSFKSNWKKDNQ
ncbi:Peptidyl-prolyl cis-trans isomerase precursor [Tenacibaculum jejuense]|uniref:Peptidyl-prolyl cis-trans isomerase n=2 Tax=Tenacibaculum jejuense TaxID=584609 RepID=A0A238U9B2_9FLAO|nr:Peptidyl-prolyl cis-trans isomerase precursor [Tenacibaculum jejuense]